MKKTALASLSLLLVTIMWPAIAENIPNRSNYARRRAVQVTSPVGLERINSNIQEGRIRGVQTVVSSYGENHRIRVSRNHPNIINTPFARAHAVGLKANYDLLPMRTTQPGYPFP